MRPRWRAAVIAAAAAGVAAALIVRLTGQDSSTPTRALTATSVIQERLSSHAVRPGLAAPISGEAVVAAAGRLLIIGGLDAAGGSANGVFSLNPGSGALRAVSALPAPLHDAAAAATHDGTLVFGGGATASTDGVESLWPGGDARSVGRLPGPRSDLAAVTVGQASYVLGGYDGSTPDASVLRTADWANLRDRGAPARAGWYPAVSAEGGIIYVFGGETGDGRPTNAVQAVDTNGGSARVIAHLPHPVSHASAVVLDGRIYVLGGTIGGKASDQILSFDPSTGSTTSAGRLPMPITNAAAAALGGSGYLIGGLGGSGTPLSSVVRLTLATAPPAGAAATGATTRTTTTTTSSTESAGAPTFPFSGHLLIADRGNDRLLLVNTRKRVVWRYPGPGRPAPPGGFYFPDDAFFTHDGTGIIANEEQDERVVQLRFPSGHLTWSYGHAGVAGSSPGYLHEPDTPTS
jgi:Kelch motif